MNGDAVLEVRGAEKVFGVLRALGGVDLTVPAVQPVRVERRMSTDKRWDWQHYPTVGMDLNGTEIVAPFLLTSFDTSCDASSTKVFEAAQYPEGFPGYVYGGENALGTYVAGGNADLSEMKIGGSTLTIRSSERRSTTTRTSTSFSPRMTFRALRTE